MMRLLWIDCEDGRNITIALEDRRFLIFKRRRLFTANMDVHNPTWFEISPARVDFETKIHLDAWANSEHHRKLWDKSRGAARGIEWPDPRPVTETRKEETQ